MSYQFLCMSCREKRYGSRLFLTRCQCSTVSQNEGRGVKMNSGGVESTEELSRPEWNRKAAARPQHIPNIKDESGTRH